MEANTNLTALNSSSTNSTNNSGSLAVTVAMSMANIIAILVGSWGNLLVVIVVVCNRGLHSSTNFFIASLASADLIVTSICMPIFYAYNVLTWPVWPFGSTVCRVSSYLVHTSVMASALSLLAISYDRFVSICFPMKRIVTKARAKITVLFIWCVSPVLLIASLLHHEVIATKYEGKDVLMCVETWPTQTQLSQYRLYRTSCYFLFVLQISVLYLIIGCKLYRRQPPGVQTLQGKAKLHFEKRKIIKMLFSVVMLFAFSWLPYIINKMLTIFPPKPGYKAPDLFVFVGNFLGLLNSVVNPIVYAALNKNFRTAFKHAIRCNCNYEVEERRRTQSVVSMRNAAQTKNRKLSSSQSRRFSESTFLDGRKNSLQAISCALPAPEANQQLRCSSFTRSETSESIMANLSFSRRLSVGEHPNYSGKRRVSFGPEITALDEITSEIDKRELKNDSAKHKRSRGNSFSNPSPANLGPIEEDSVFHEMDENRVNRGFDFDGLEK